jgi:hypothetical protein
VVVATCRNAGLSPTLVDMPDGQVKRALFAVASGVRGWRGFPSPWQTAYVAPGVRFVRLDGEQPAFATAVVTRRDPAHVLTVAFLRAVSRATRIATARRDLFVAGIIEYEHCSDSRPWW